MNIQLEPKRESASGIKLILPIALCAAILLGAILFLWVRSAGTAGRQPEVEGLTRKGSADYEKYHPLLATVSKKATVQRNYARQRTVLVSGVIHNGSDRWLEALEMRIILFQGDQPVLTETRLPLFPGSRAKPVSPQGDFQFSLMLEKIPLDWTGGSFDLEITGFKLAGK
ncbi:MAG TPA: hypothetical protein VGL91_21705 [Acidobacteriota bacterium]|jgi:hypothetical protein